MVCLPSMSMKRIRLPWGTTRDQYSAGCTVTTSNTRLGTWADWLAAPPPALPNSKRAHSGVVLGVGMEEG